MVCRMKKDKMAGVSRYRSHWMFLLATAEAVAGVGYNW